MFLNLLTFFRAAMTWSPGTHGINNHVVVFLQERPCSVPQPCCIIAYLFTSLWNPLVLSESSCFWPRMNITWWRAKRERECKQLCMFGHRAEVFVFGVCMLLSWSRWVWVLIDYTGWSGSFHTLPHYMMNNWQCFHQLFLVAPLTLSNLNAHTHTLLNG